MKKALSLLLAALMLLSVLTACGPQSGSESTDPPADKTDAAPPLSLINIRRSRRLLTSRSRWAPYD